MIVSEGGGGFGTGSSSSSNGFDDDYEGYEFLSFDSKPKLNINFVNSLRQEYNQILEIYRKAFDDCNAENVNYLLNGRFGQFQVEDMARTILKSCNPDNLNIDGNIDDIFNKINYDTKVLNYNTNTIEGALLHNLKLVKQKYDNRLQQIVNWLDLNLKPYVVIGLGTSISAICAGAVGATIVLVAGCGGVGTYYISTFRMLDNYTRGYTDTLDFKQVSNEVTIATWLELAFGVPFKFLWKSGRYIWTGRGVVSASVNKSFASIQIQKKFKHAKDFGINGNYSNANATLYEKALTDFTKNNPSIVGAKYRNQNVIIYNNNLTRQAVIYDTDGNFISAWKLSIEQQNSLNNIKNIQ